MESSDIAALIFFAPLVAIWISLGILFCAYLLRMAYEFITGDL